MATIAKFLKTPRHVMDDELAFQAQMLQGVSRTFALTIPQLPTPLYRVVGNAYLLCRIADTVEDDALVPLEEKQRLYNLFIEVIAQKQSATEFAERLYPLLSDQTSAAEKELIQNTPRVIKITHSFSNNQRAILHRCLTIMSKGMEKFIQNDTAKGLKDIHEIDSYCYHVAGVVGEMLTELFCDYSSEIQQNQVAMRKLAVSFGQGLQMTNILKDIWEDKERGYCWLPKQVFDSDDFDLAQLSPTYQKSIFENGLVKLLALAHGHLRNALTYTLQIPRHEKGIRRFCLYAIGMAALTLNKINNHRAFTEGKDVKISRKSVKATILASNLLVGNDLLLRAAFLATAKKLPFTFVDAEVHCQCSCWDSVIM